MPEGHVIHRLADEFRERFTRRVAHVTSPQGRFAEGAALLDGRKITGADAVGKHLFVRFGRDLDLHVHLGIYGRFTFGDVPPPEPVGQIRLRLVTTTGWADLRGPMTCDVVNPPERAELEARLGDDPLRSDADGRRAWAKIHKSRAPLATLLMDQSVLAGVGNIFRAEVLFRGGIDPQLPGNRLTADQWAGLWDDLVALMAYGYAQGRIDTVRPEHEPEAMGRPPRVDDHGGEVYVYRRAGAPCLVCGDTVRTSDHGGRNLFWCPSCQRP